MIRLPSGASRLVFILAHPADHVRAPEFYTPHFWQRGLDWHMVPLDVEPQHLATTVRTLARSDSVIGFNITVPHKRAACELCDSLGPAAAFVRVVNTLRVESDGRLVGETFDGEGFVQAARARGVLDLQRRCLVIGAGGAGRAICYALVADGLRRLAIVDKDRALAESLAGALIEAFDGLDIRLDDRTDDVGLIVNATPLGLHQSDPLPIPLQGLAPDCAVFDIIAARRTALVAAAEALSLRVVDGVPMITHQLDAQTNFWLGL